MAEKRHVWGWDSFEKRLLTGPRFLFSATEAEWGEESVESVFRFLARLAERITTGFLKTHDPPVWFCSALARRDFRLSRRRTNSDPRRHPTLLPSA